MRNPYKSMALRQHLRSATFDYLAKATYHFEFRSKMSSALVLLRHQECLASNLHSFRATN